MDPNSHASFETDRITFRIEAQATASKSGPLVPQ